MAAVQARRWTNLSGALVSLTNVALGLVILSGHASHIDSRMGRWPRILGLLPIALTILAFVVRHRRVKHGPTVAGVALLLMGVTYVTLLAHVRVARIPVPWIGWAFLLLGIPITAIGIGRTLAASPAVTHTDGEVVGRTRFWARYLSLFLASLVVRVDSNSMYVLIHRRLGWVFSRRQAVPFRLIAGIDVIEDQSRFVWMLQTPLDWSDYSVELVLKNGERAKLFRFRDEGDGEAERSARKFARLLSERVLEHPFRR
jgi:cytochrome bd-type quinol oxidase subunit 2